ncbi:MAG: class I SAM-dependent methyltransferase [Candidatus Krumholzibacteriia bacterium]
MQARRPPFVENPPTSDYPIPYGEEMLQRILRMHAGAEKLPMYHEWIRDHMGGRVVAFRRQLMPQVRVFTDLRDMDILDFGCGTGSTTVALSEQAEGSRLTAIDIDADSLDIAALRFEHHGIRERVNTLHIPPVSQVGDLDFEPESIDFILANGVLEHVVPFSTRPSVILEMWRLLRPGGLVFISETPNPLWPIDRHTTGLPFIPWLPSGLAHRVAVACGRHRPGTDLDARGRRGMSWWEIARPLRAAGHPFEVLNISVAGNRLLPAGRDPGVPVSAKRRLAHLLLERIAGKPLAALGIPTIALGPFIEHLCLRKTTRS